MSQEKWNDYRTLPSSIETKDGETIFIQGYICAAKLDAEVINTQKMVEELLSDAINRAAKHCGPRFVLSFFERAKPLLEVKERCEK